MRAIKVVDVFSAQPLKGNPVAVVFDSDGLSDERMQSIARWTNLSETVFVQSPTSAWSDYRLRIFTPMRELPFAGHPSLGAAHAVIEAGKAQPIGGRLTQECGAGHIPIQVEPDGAGGQRLGLVMPKARMTPVETADIAELESVLGAPLDLTAPPTIASVGPVWLIARVASSDALLALRPDLARLAALERRLDLTGVTLFAPGPAGGDIEIEARSFAPSSGVDEDPVCGSGNGAIGAVLAHHGLRAPGRYVAGQGRATGRDGRVFVGIGPQGAVSIAGGCVTVVDGTLQA